jgi:membrane fusion protein (multidrug efflux system)
VTKIGFQSGDVVAQNQVLVQLDTSVEQAELIAAEARVRLARSTLSRMRQAATSQAVTAAEVEEAEAQFDQASATVAQLSAVIAKKTLRAPFPGKIGLSNTHIGQFLPSGFQIASLQSNEDFIYVDFMMPQPAADAVRVGDPVNLADASSNYVATIVAMDARADRQSRNLMARAKLSPVPPTLVPGDSVRVVLEYGQALQTAAIPLESLRRAPMNTFVYVAEADQKNQLRAHARTVRIGKTIGQQISVLDGLGADERVVADGSFKLHEGALIMPVEVGAHAAPDADSSGNSPSEPAAPEQTGAARTATQHATAG